MFTLHRGLPVHRAANELETGMKSFVVQSENTRQFQVVDQPVPEPLEHDLRVRVEAISLNPIDTKVRAGRAGQVLGWDASGVVEAVGKSVTGFKVGDSVYYAGDITRPGCNAEFHLVDARIAAHKPKSLDHLHAAAIPLTALTAWEGLYEQLEVKQGRSLLVINSAGGVGSLVLQMAKKLSGMTVIGTASRDESRAWSKAMGADHIINHREDMPAQLEALDIPHVDYIYCCYATEPHFPAMVKMIAPEGRIVSIVGAESPLPVGDLFRKKASFSWELMFAKAMFQTPTLASQGEILSKVATSLDAGTLRHTLNKAGGVLTANTLAEAHAFQESGRAIGKQAFWMREPSSAT